MFADRRRRFMERMQEGVALVFAAPETVRSNDTEYRFRQNSDFFYLTGFPEPDAAALFMPGHPDHEFVLFVRPRDRERETWNGRRFGPEGAKEHFGADAAYTLDKMPEVVGGFLENAETLHYRLGLYPDRDREVLDLIDGVRRKIREGVRAPAAVRDPGAVLHEMRLFKSRAEIEIMRQAAVISAEAHRNAMEMLKPGMREYEVEALIEYTFRRHGAAGPAYTTIAGSGDNATILHYTENTDLCRDGELLLVDAGAEYNGYAADITRTFPVNGRFSPDQRAVYEVVLAAQLAGIEKVRPGCTFNDVHTAALKVLVEGLARLGILDGEPEALIESEAYKPYYMHRTSHWLGMDVHDVGRYREGDTWRDLEPGMVLTVEPGLYFAVDRDEVPERFRGIGIRIEDDVLVTTGEPDVLTRETPKTVCDVETAMTGAAATAIG